MAHGGGGEVGAALATVLLLLVSLTVLGIAAVTAARLDTRIVASTLGPEQARARAEEGIAWAEGYLRGRAVWDPLLDPAGWSPLPLPATAAGFTVWVRDDDDLDGDPGRDTNGVVIVRAEGRVGVPGSRDASVAVVEAGLRRPGFATFYPQAGGAANGGGGG